jgi:uncharacterized membrane protein YhhN
MFCGECGTQNPDTNQFCKNCGKPLRRPQQVPAPQPAAVPVQPVAVQPQVQPLYYQPQPAGLQATGVIAGAAAPAKPPLNKGMLVLGIVGIVFGIVSWIFYPYLCGFAAFLIGGITFYKAGNRKGIVGIVAVIALVLGLASILVNYFYFVLFPPLPDTLITNLGFQLIG